MTDITIAMPSALKSWVESRVAEGAYTDAGDYLRDLIRRDQAEAGVDRQWLKAMIDEGIASGVLDQDPREIIEELIAEDPDLRD